MTRMYGSSRSSESGMALLYAVFAVFVAASFIAVTMTLATVTHRTTQFKRFDTEAEYLAEGAIESAKKQIQTSIANWIPVPANGSVTIDGKIVDYTIAPTGFAEVVTDPSGIQRIVTGYEVDSTGTANGTPADAHRILNALATPLFQFAVFYDSDLEIFPGPDMTIRGRVHSNRDLYLGSNATLTFNTNHVRASGNVHRNRKDDPTASPGNVRIRNWVANPFDAAEPLQYTMMNSRSQMTSAGVTTPSGYDSYFTDGYDANGNDLYTDIGDWLPFAPGALAYWAQPSGYASTGHTLMTQEHGVSEIVPPGVGSTAMFEANANGDYAWDAGQQCYVPVAPGTGSYSRGYYHSRADLSIITFANGTWKAYDAAGTEITAAVAPAISIHPMYDARQANGTSAMVDVTQIDLEVLGTTGHYPANGLLYAGIYGVGTGTDANGIRLVNGATLTGKLTVATPDPIYIWGDFNSSNEQPAAVICDAFNLLSNAWNDSKTQGVLPVGSDTTYNVAVVTGNVDTVGTQYSGGLENLPRFHENWSGRTATIKGSFVKSWFSQYANSPWVYGGDRYTAPNRNWSYNVAFNSVVNLPPFTPMAVEAVDVVSW